MCKRFYWTIQNKDFVCRKSFRFDEEFTLWFTLFGQLMDYWFKKFCPGLNYKFEVRKHNEMNTEYPCHNICMYEYDKSFAYFFRLLTKDCGNSFEVDYYCSSIFSFLEVFKGDSKYEFVKGILKLLNAEYIKLQTNLSLISLSEEEKNRILNA